MRLLLVTQYFWPESFRVNHLVEAWRELGHDVTVLANMPSYPAGRTFEGYSWRGPYRETYCGADVRRVPTLPRGRRRNLRVGLTYLSFIASSVILAPFVARGRYDAVFVYAPSPITVALPAMLMKRLRGAPMAIWVQDLWPDNLASLGIVRSPTLLRMATALGRWIYRRCDLVLVQSAAFDGPVRRVCPEVAKIRVLPNWADDFYRPEIVEPDAPERREFPGGFTIVFGGNLGSAQALEIVLDAAAMLRDGGVRWVFIGDGHERASLESESRRRGLDDVVRFLGWRPETAMPRYLSLADALLVSLRRNESFASTIPAKLQTSLAVGRPILAALEGEGARIVRDARAGVVVEPENARALADGVRALMTAGAEARAEMGRRGRAYATAHFDRATLVAQLDEWLREMKETRA
jgi:glycosyltransferase involved in cell wall biosynthesis